MRKAVSILLVLICLSMVSCSKDSSSSAETKAPATVTAKESTAPEQKADESSSTDVAEPADNSVFEQVENLDKFGDPTGEFYVQAKNDFEGTYSIEGGATNGNLKWNFELYEDEVKFILKEQGYTGNLSAARLITDGFSIDVKYESGDIISHYGTVARGNEGNYNCISVTSFYDDSGLWRSLPEDLKSGGVYKIVISNDHGTYNLGEIDVTEIERLFYDVDTYNEIMKIYESGDYSEALNMINNLEASDAVTYSHFDLRDIEIESLYQVMYLMLFQDLEYEAVIEGIKDFRTLYWSDSIWDDNPKEYEIVELQYYAILALYNAGKHEAVINGIEDFKYYYEEYNAPELDAMYYDSHKALGIFAVGMKGPAGGYVFYDCDADNDTGNADGLISSECGWRYLEAAPNDLRVVNGVPTVDSSANGYAAAASEYRFGYYRTSDNGTNIYVNGTAQYDGTTCASTHIGKGESNTEKLVNAMGTSAYSFASSWFGVSEKTPDYAARLCSVLSHGGYDDWFLPSKDELDLMYDNLKTEGIGSFSGDAYWSSSEYNYYDGASYAWGQYFSDGYQTYGARESDVQIRPCRAF